MTWISDHKNPQKKNSGSGITPSYFPALMNLAIFGYFSQHYKPAFYIEGFKV